MQDEEFMREALQLARNAEGRTSPNPMVGAVIVRDGRIVLSAGTGRPVRRMRRSMRCAWQVTWPRGRRSM